MKKSCLCLFLCLICLCSVACGRTPIPSAELLSALMEESQPLPDGTVYVSTAEEGSESYPSPSLLRALYGEKAEEALVLAEDYAIYLSSFAFPAEIAVFRCYSASDTHHIAALCLNRSDEIKIALRGTKFEKASDSIQVVTKGSYVIMIFTESEKDLQKEALRLVG